MSDSVLILDSSSASVKSLTDGEATWFLEVPLSFPNRNPVFCLNTFSFTNFFVNITTGANDTIYYTDDLGDLTKYSIVFPQGSYSVETLNNYWVAKLLEDGVAPNLASFEGDYSQQKVFIRFGALIAAGFVVYFGAQSPFALMGATTLTNYPAILNVGNEVVYFANVAQFNNIERINIHTNLGNNFIYSSKAGDIIYSTSPVVSVGSVDLQKPNNLLWCVSDALRSGISVINIYLTDQNGSRITMTEDFMIILQIKS